MNQGKVLKCNKQHCIKLKKKFKQNLKGSELRDWIITKVIKLLNKNSTTARNNKEEKNHKRAV